MRKRRKTFWKHKNKDDKASKRIRQEEDKEET